MWKWCTAAVYLVSTLAFVTAWKQGKKQSLPSLCFAVIVAVATGVAVSPVFWEGSFPAALLAGQAVYWGWAWLAHRRDALLPCAFISLSSIMPWLPLCLSKAELWQYALLFAALLACLLLAIAGRFGRDRGSIAQAGDPDMAKPWRHFWIYLPLAMLPLGITALLTAADLTAANALMLSGTLFASLALLLALGEQIRRRQKAEALTDELSRWQRESRDYMNTIRSQRHDFNLHLHAISGLITGGDYEGCREYMQKLTSEAAAVNDIMPVSDPVVGAMLYNMREEARREGSDITYHITYDMGDIICNGFECNKIIGNLLKNAIEALQTPEDKAFGISMRIFKRRGNTVIAVENRFIGERDQIARVFEAGYSNKKNHEGIGLSMVLRTAARYGGRVYPEFEDDIIRFVVNIPNKVNLTEGRNKNDDSSPDFR